MIDQPSGAEVAKIVRDRTGPATMLAFSAGKDSVAAFLNIRDTFDQIVPFYLYLVPDLAFVEEALTFYEETLFGGRKIIRMPHPSLYRWLSGGVYQPPHNIPVLEAARLPNFTHKDVHDIIRDQFGIPDAMVATGVRAADSPMRHVSIKQHGPILKSKGEYFPVWDWKKADLVRELRRHSIQLSREYEVFGRSFDGLDARFLIPMRDHFPDDFAKVLEWFPLAEASIFRFERMAGK